MHLNKYLVCYFDIICPNSWNALGILQPLTAKLSIDFVPISDVKLEMIRMKEFNDLRARNRGQILNIQRPLGSLRSEQKRLDDYGENRLPSDWRDIFADSLDQPSVLPSIYLAAVKKEFPAFYMGAIENMGNRLWNERRDIFRSHSLSTISREIGLQFKDSEYVISHLSHRRFREVLDDHCREVHVAGGLVAPFFALHNPSSYRFFHCIRDLISNI